MNTKLLRKVAKHILALPQRLKMDSYVERQDKDWHQRVSFGPDGEKERAFPSCGTVACIAGWTCELGSKNAKRIEWHSAVAKRLLGLTKKEACRLFIPAEWPTEFAQGLADDGEKATAESAVARIEHFIKTKGRE